MTRWVLVVIISAVAGCASTSPPPPPHSALLLVQADRLVAQGQYTGALEAYGEIVSRYPNTEDAARARGHRDALASLLATRAQIARLTGDMKAQEAELARAREQLAGRDGELARARLEIARLTAEADRLRTDLEHLKKIDIDLERRRK